jgi:hypothetical protein
MMRALVPVTVIVASAMGSCAASRPPVRPLARLTPDMAQLFDDSVDYVHDVRGLGGRLSNDWRRQIDGLSATSDLIGVAQIETVILGTDSERKRDYRLTATLTDVVQGKAPRDGHVVLHVTEGQNGFGTVAGKEHRLQSARYVVFVKYTSDHGQERAHWHLTPLSDSLLGHVRYETGADNTRLGRERIVRREGSHLPPATESKDDTEGM